MNCFEKTSFSQVMALLVYLLHYVVGLLQRLVGDPLDNFVLCLSQLGMVLHANSELTGDDQGPVEVL